MSRSHHVPLRIERGATGLWSVYVGQGDNATQFMGYLSEHDAVAAGHSFANAIQRRADRRAERKFVRDMKESGLKAALVTA